MSASKNITHKRLEIPGQRRIWNSGCDGAAPPPFLTSDICQSPPTVAAGWQYLLLRHTWKQHLFVRLRWSWKMLFSFWKSTWKINPCGTEKERAWLKITNFYLNLEAALMDLSCPSVDCWGKHTSPFTVSTLQRKGGGINQRSYSSWLNYIINQRRPSLEMPLPNLP